MIDCYCGLSADAEGPAVFEATWRRARIRHTCCECGGDILPGQRYEVTKGCWDGEWSTFKTCRSCATIWAQLFCGSRIFGELREALSEVFGVQL